ncbi:hypothetical protein B0H11DRAFT_2077818 [Mycena galericulata]|nr:hypothetical protein B0H11DRAFT_2077818 [Mycena galericulata]
MPELPAELVDLTTSILVADKPALLTCSLLSRKWLPWSRQYDSRFSTVPLAVSWDSKNRKGLDRIHTFIDIISSPLATFVPLVAEVRLTHKWNTRAEGTVISPGEILHALNRLGIQPSRLYLDCYRYLTSPPDGPPAFASSLLHLELELDENYVALDGIVDYVCSYPLLESLEIRGLPDNVNPTPPASLALPPQLHTLRIGHKLFTDWIITLTPAPKQLTTLELIGIPGFQSKWSAMNRYLSSPAAENTQTIIFHDCHPSTGRSGGPNFESLRRLKHIVIRQPHARAPSTLLSILSFLRTTPASRTLQTITLSMSFLELAAHYKPNKWLEVDEALADAAEWPRLRGVTLSTHDEDGEELRGYLGNAAAEAGMDAIALVLHIHLGKCADRGMLKIENIPVVPPELLVTGERIVERD